MTEICISQVIRCNKRKILFTLHIHCIYAAINRHLKLTLLKGHQRFDTIAMSNLEVLKFRDCWIFNKRVLLFYSSPIQSKLWYKNSKSAWWIFTQLNLCSRESLWNCFEKEVNWWWILSRFKMLTDACMPVSNHVGCSSTAFTLAHDWLQLLHNNCQISVACVKCSEKEILFLL